MFRIAICEDEKVVLDFESSLIKEWAAGKVCAGRECADHARAPGKSATSGTGLPCSENAPGSASAPGKSATSGAGFSSGENALGRRLVLDT